MTSSEDEKRRRVTRLKMLFDAHMKELDTVGLMPKTMKKQLKEFLSTQTGWQDAYTNDELATLFYDFVYGKEPREMTDSEWRHKHKALQNIRNVISNIRRDSQSVIPASIRQRDVISGERQFRTVNITKQSHLNKRINMTESIKDGIDNQDNHIERVYEAGLKARKEALIQERLRTKRRNRRG